MVSCSVSDCQQLRLGPKIGFKNSTILSWYVKTAFTSGESYGNYGVYGTKMIFAGCKLLAKEHGVEVDFPKTGKHGKITKDLEPDQYPDYMRKDDCKSYLLFCLVFLCNSSKKKRYYTKNSHQK